MAISNNASYIPTMNEFLAHWEQVDVAMGFALTVMREDKVSMSQASFTTLRATLQTQLSAVVTALNDVEIAREDIRLKKVKMLAWINEFVGLVDAYYQGTTFLRARPYVPSVTDGEERFQDPMRDMASLWVKLNEAPPAPTGITLPLQLRDGTSQATFALALGALQTAHATLAKAEQDVILARAVRDQTKGFAYSTMKVYRTAVRSRCTQFPTLVQKLPHLTPAPGHTPDAVNASAVFQAPDKSKVVYAESTDAQLLRYELRGNPGPQYDEDDAVVIATNLPGDAREFETDFALTQPGTVVALKVYVVLTTGNEAGSATMVVQRPA